MRQRVRGQVHFQVVVNELDTDARGVSFGKFEGQSLSQGLSGQGMGELIQIFIAKQFAGPR